MNVNASSQQIVIRLNGAPHPLPRPMTVEELLAELQLADRPVAVEVNGHVIPKAEHPRRHLADNDQVEIVTFVGGG